MFDKGHPIVAGRGSFRERFQELCARTQLLALMQGLRCMLIKVEVADPRTRAREAVSARA